MERVYAVTLAKDTDSPLKPKSDEVEIAKDEKKDDAKKDPKVADAKDEKPGDANGKDDKKDAKPKKPVVVKVDEDGLKDRLVALPITPANYDAIQAVGDKVYYLRNTVGDENGDDQAGPDGGPGPRAGVSTILRSARKRSWDASTRMRSRPTARRCW